MGWIGAFGMIAKTSKRQWGQDRAMTGTPGRPLPE